MDTSKLTPTPFGWLIWQLNKMLESGKYGDITIEEVYRHIGDRSVLRWLREIAGSDIDLSPLLDADTYGNFDELFANYLHTMVVCYGGEERRKWGIQTKGICLLIAWTTEAIMDGNGWEPQADLFRKV